MTLKLQLIFSFVIIIFLSYNFNDFFIIKDKGEDQVQLEGPYKTRSKFLSGI